jgi:hypothetical protein
MGTVALLEPCGLGLRRDVAVEDQPVGGVLDQQAATRERRGRDLRALMVQADRAAEEVPQVQGPDPLVVRVSLAGEGQVTVLVAQADLVLAGCAILDAIRRAFPCERLRVADRGLREGMLVEMMRADGVWGQA